MLNFFKRIGVFDFLRMQKNSLCKAVVSRMRFPTYSVDKVNNSIDYIDYFRYATLALAVQRILIDKIEGNFAEVGVYKGDVSKFIHELSPGHKYFLFDTFEGFPKKDLEDGVIEDKRFSDSTVEKVLRNIGDTENVVIRKGYVPDTLSGLEEEIFSFVLLDLDLYNPTQASLEFFYPRLAKGGYLIVHDYNNPESNWACKRATDEFFNDKPESLVEIADVWGSVLIRKAK